MKVQLTHPDESHNEVGIKEIFYNGRKAVLTTEFFHVETFVQVLELKLENLFYI